MFTMSFFLLIFYRRWTSWPWRPVGWWEEVTPEKRQLSSGWDNNFSDPCRDTPTGRGFSSAWETGKNNWAQRLLPLSDFLFPCPPGMCCLQFHHHPVSQQHLQSSQPLSAVGSGCLGKPVSLSGWAAASFLNYGTSFLPTFLLAFSSFLFFSSHLISPSFSPFLTPS